MREEFYRAETLLYYIERFDLAVIVSEVEPVRNWNFKLTVSYPTVVHKFVNTLTEYDLLRSQKT